MKREESGDFCVLHVEQTDERNALFQTIAKQKKPVVILLLEQAQVFQRPDDFTALKYVKRQMDVPIMFVIPKKDHLAQLAGRNGFPVYLSMEALSDALAMGQLGKQRTLNRITAPLSASERASGAIPVGVMPQRTAPLSLLEEEVFARRTAPLVKPAPSAVTPLPKAPPPVRRRLPVAMVVLLTVALALAGLGSFLVLFNKLPTSNAVVASANAPMGHVEFLSSEQLSENSSQGIADELLIDLNDMPPAAHGKSYYAWLLSDKKQSDMKAIYIGSLPVSNGHAHLLYQGDAQHTNLLLAASRFLVTEEDAAVTPITPSPDLSTWRYYGEFSQTPINSPDNTKHFSYLDHLRHLLASDPTLDQLGLSGGLNNWFYRNSSKVLEWATSMREQWEDTKDVGFVRRQTIRTLTYLDGLSFVKQDLPSGTPMLVNERLASVGLITVNGPNQEPPGYLLHVVHHLNGLLQSGLATPALRKNIASIVTAMNDVTYWLTQMRHDAQQLMQKSDQQLQQPATLSLINDMIADANNAYVGQTDPSTGEKRQGVVWIHEQMQLLATLPITHFVATGSSSIQMMPSNKHFTAFHLDTGAK